MNLGGRCAVCRLCCTELFNFSAPTRSYLQNEDNDISFARNCQNLKCQLLLVRARHQAPLEPAPLRKVSHWYSGLRTGELFAMLGACYSARYDEADLGVGGSLKTHSLSTKGLIKL